jgi:hypothetical protein
MRKKSCGVAVMEHAIMAISPRGNRLFAFHNPANGFGCVGIASSHLNHAAS